MAILGKRAGTRGNVPAALALNGISYNIARSFGPAIGGIVVATAGAVAAFALNAVLYIPLLVVLFLWRRTPSHRACPANVSTAPWCRACVISPTRPRSDRAGTHAGDGLDRRLGIGTDAAGRARSPAWRRANLRHHARRLRHGRGDRALNIGEVRKRMSGEAAVRGCTLTMAGAIAAVALSRQPVLTAAALVVAGAAWMLAVALFNIGVQLSAPRWVAGRSLAAFQASIAGGIAIGSWGWGRLTDAAGVETALLIPPALMLASPLLGRWLHAAGRRPQRSRRAACRPRGAAAADRAQRAPGGRDRISRRSGKARAFHNVMQEVQLSRQRNGAYGWSIARDIADPELWTERYHCPTWLDFCASAIARRNRSARCISARWIFISGPTRCGSAECWNGRSARCAGRKIRPTAPPARCCRSPRRQEAARSVLRHQCGASTAGDAPCAFREPVQSTGFLEVAVHHGTATAAQIGPLLHHAGGHPRECSDLAEAERVAGCSSSPS